jgi:glycosyltransferase involved in cell wall biosynthesis
MRIGINIFALSDRLGMAGSGRYILELIRALVKLDHGHELVLFGNADNLYLLPPNGCQRVDCGWTTAVRPSRLLWEQFALPLALRRYQIDVLHSPVFVAPLWVPCASVVTILDMTWFSLPGQHTWVKRSYFRTMIPPTARRAARIIAISEASKQDVVALLGMPAEKVVVTYLGVDLNVFCPEAAEGRAGELEARYGVRQPYVLYVGKLEPRKNLPTLIEAFVSIARGFPDHQLVLAGNPGWDFQAIYETAARIPRRERVRFTGFVDEADLPALYAGADLFVYPSSYEGFGIPVLEAMACGTPVITSNVSSLPEVAGDAGLLVDPLDVSELAQAMRRVLTDGQLRQRMRAKGLERAKTFTWKETARRTLQVYEEAYALAQKQVTWA